MADLQDAHGPCGVVDDVEDAVGPLPNPDHVREAGELLTSAGPWLG
jgi:hypothetical protein